MEPICKLVKFSVLCLCNWKHQTNKRDGGKSNQKEMAEYEIITFYEFRSIRNDELVDLRDSIRTLMCDNSIKGTFVLAEEGFNATVCGLSDNIAKFVSSTEELLRTKLKYKSSFNQDRPFRRVDVKIKPEIVTLKHKVDMAAGAETHVSPGKWNEIITDPKTIVLDARNDYEYQTGTFKGAINPQTTKFSELPRFINENLDPDQHKRVAMFCTGGIRCEKFAPYMKQLGFDEVCQLDGGILKYLETVPAEESLWEGECFVFDDRVTVDTSLKKGKTIDLSQKGK